MTNSEYKKKVLEQMCHFLAGSIYSSVVTSKELARSANITLYRVRKTLKELEAEGLVEKLSEGIRPEYSYEGECIHEGYPPRNGWTVTQSVILTDMWKQAVDEANKSFAQWANGKEYV